jgi:hypothetical protein
VTVTLNAPAPAGGTVVSLGTNANPQSILPVPASLTVPAGQTSSSASVTAGSVSGTTTVTATASYSGIQMAASVIVKPRHRQALR